MRDLYGELWLRVSDLERKLLSRRLDPTQMLTRIYVPYTRLSEATRCFLASPHTAPVPVVMMDCSCDDWAYNDYLIEVWAKGKDFINFEHDIVPWPGAIQELLACPYPWCFFGYQDQVKDLAASGAAMFGLVRFRAPILTALPQVWTDRKAMGEGPEGWPVPWRGMDTHFFTYATQRGYRPHQHYPSVMNANPGILTAETGLPEPEWRFA
jgi:hypothetical protein